MSAATTNSTAPTTTAPTNGATTGTGSTSITQGVKDFFKGSHKADSTEVCTEHAPEIVQEHVRPQEHTQTAEAIDRERHIHHHQHRIQPIEHKVALDPKHVHVTGAAVVREHKEDMLPEHQETLHAQRTLHTNQQTTGDVEKSHAHIGTHINTHEHHHIHETIQPVIQRETIQPTVIHHTAAIHEKVHEAPIVHEVTTLPPIGHDQFLKLKEGLSGATHSDKSHSHQHYEGAPRVGGHTSQTGTTSSAAPSTTQGPTTTI
ncbi:hypothetical protein L202_05043 [Cryptococcus amylolentus CBS 6039]|uniref:Allergen n=2 Tax=Cryptococcus amylolentus TaxID=104669 RepID=A0A1E3HQF0_9TREE|nr:hypothetical protein L202_05043 [Cryptococcus amylolentus CBS 6039]ODN77946.1 hypothetical protein L202_05043 [Cryptococcus amylolentus CBS 6039]ODO05905.1 hypothetical protein I350_04966 [Cryptococcus amylolentus CBS 6273]